MLLYQINYYADTIYASAGVEATHSQYVTVGAGVVNIVMTIISVSDLEHPFHGVGGGPRQVTRRQTGAPQGPLRGVGDMGPGPPEGHGVLDAHVLNH